MLTKDILVLKKQILKKYTTTIDNLCTHKRASMKKKLIKRIYIWPYHISNGDTIKVVWVGLKQRFDSKNFCIARIHWKLNLCKKLIH